MVYSTHDAPLVPEAFRTHAAAPRLPNDGMLTITRGFKDLIEVMLELRAGILHLKLRLYRLRPPLYILLSSGLERIPAYKRKRSVPFRTKVDFQAQPKKHSTPKESVPALAGRGVHSLRMPHFRG